MKQSRITIGIIAVAALFFSTYTPFFALQNLTGSLVKPTPILASCSATNDFFKLEYTSITRDNDVVDQWKTNFHDLMNSLTNAQLNDELIIDCTALTIGQFLQPTGAMSEILNTWEPFMSDPDSQKLSRLDIGHVQLELLRQYECALLERARFAETTIGPELVYEMFRSTFAPGSREQFGIKVKELADETNDQREKIVQEIGITRETVEQVVRLLNGKERTTIIKAEAQCLERASLDIRNASGLLAEATSCLPRIWNSRDVLTDLPE
jgi:hypothetical protein